MEPLTAPEREAKTDRQIAMVDEQLTKEFSILPAQVVHREVASVSNALLTAARFSDHVAVLTGRYAAEHLKVAALNSPA
jgi:hypothetical protein